MDPCPITPLFTEGYFHEVPFIKWLLLIDVGDGDRWSIVDPQDALIVRNKYRDILFLCETLPSISVLSIKWLLVSH